MEQNNLDLEKLDRRINAILEEFSRLGFDLREEFLELIEHRSEIKTMILENKIKNFTYFHDDVDKKFVGVNIADYNISFEFEYGEDEEGPYYDVEAFIVKS